MSRTRKRSTASNKEKLRALRAQNAQLMGALQQAQQLLLRAQWEITGLRLGGETLSKENLELKEKLGLTPQMPDEEDLGLMECQRDADGSDCGACERGICETIEFGDGGTVSSREVAQLVAEAMGEP
jgi:hypothetical protein